MWSVRAILSVATAILLGGVIVELMSHSCARERLSGEASVATDRGAFGDDALQGRSRKGAATSRDAAQARMSEGPAQESDPALALLARGGLAGDASLADVVASVVPSVVNLSSTRVLTREGPPQEPQLFQDPLFRHFFREFPFEFWDRPRERRELSLGSAVIVSTEGILLTNSHVVENAEAIAVSFTDGRQLTAAIVGTDPLSDVAVLRLKERSPDLSAIELGDSSELRLGDFVIAIGNPFGVGQTVTLGIVSATGRANLGIVDYEDFIQTDAAINPGNSGGALVDLDAKLVGINTAILSRTGGYQGIGFAIPVNMVHQIMNELIQHGRVVRGWLGVAIQELTPPLAEALGVESKRGVLISDVSKDGPAEKAGLRARDVIVEVDGEPVTSAGRLRNEIAARGAGADVDLVVMRERRRMRLRARLGELPAPRRATGTPARKGEREEDDIISGFRVGALTPEAREHFGIPTEVRYGVLVTSVAPGSPAERSGLAAGDVILEVNRKVVDTIDTFNDLYRGAKGVVLLRVIRDGTSLFLAIERRS